MHTDGKGPAAGGEKVFHWRFCAALVVERKAEADAVRGRKIIE
ncbi:hypothetical protein HMPREF0620_0748 [Parascardovia denticolens DSM 10105 = JCM 12538]|uniref:Uncharacterized protein n=1 Tax=Parascardovia denticolens DSM 10105 = JCM 12538 TaxID=864564 RepID=E6K1R2_PARDN|nr:hypothetical protein HMPREF0620_0748 [Parascardovia denticolens DSM 10105 = JCM 12538]